MQFPGKHLQSLQSDNASKDQVIDWVMNFQTVLNEEFGEIEKDLKITIKEIETPSSAMDKESSGKASQLAYLLSSWCDCLVA